MPTETDLANGALAKASGAGDQESGTALIASINGTDRVSVRCKFLLPTIRKRVLSDLAEADAAPIEALQYLDLNAEITTTLKMGGYTYAFNVPNNVIRVMKQTEEVFNTLSRSIDDKPNKYPFQIRWQGTQQILFTNWLTNTAGNSAFVEVCIDQTNIGTWNEKLIEAVKTLLGAELVPTVGGANATREESL